MKWQMILQQRIYNEIEKELRELCKQEQLALLENKRLLDRLRELQQLLGLSESEMEGLIPKKRLRCWSPEEARQHPDQCLGQ